MPDPEGDETIGKGIGLPLISDIAQFTSSGIWHRLLGKKKCVNPSRAAFVAVETGKAGKLSPTETNHRSRTE